MGATMRQHQRVAATVAAVTAMLVAVMAGAFALPQTASAWTPQCSGTTRFVEKIITHEEGGEITLIQVIPTSEARLYPGDRSVVVEQWHAVQACVPGLYGELADSIWQQLECHQKLTDLPGLRPGDGGYATGPSYDLETATDPMRYANHLTYLLSMCKGDEGLKKHLAPFKYFAGA